MPETEKRYGYMSDNTLVVPLEPDGYLIVKCRTDEERRRNPFFQIVQEAINQALEDDCWTCQ